MNEVDDDDDDDYDVTSTTAAGMTMVGRAVMDLTEGCEVVVEGAMVVLVGPGGEVANFRIDRRATPLWAIFSNYELFSCGTTSSRTIIPSDASPLDTLRFVHGGRRLPHYSDETACDSGILDGDVIRVIRTAEARVEGNAPGKAKIGIKLLDVVTDDAEFFVVDPAAPFDRIFHNYSQERVKIPMASLRFLHGDRTLHSDDTPSNVDLRDGEIIHVLIKGHQNTNLRMLQLTPNAVETIFGAMESGKEWMSFDPIVQVMDLKTNKLEKNVLVRSIVYKLCTERDIQTFTLIPIINIPVLTESSMCIRADDYI